MTFIDQHPGWTVGHMAMTFAIVFVSVLVVRTFILWRWS